MDGSRHASGEGSARRPPPAKKSGSSSNGVVLERGGKGNLWQPSSSGGSGLKGGSLGVGESMPPPIPAAGVRVGVGGWGVGCVGL